MCFPRRRSSGRKDVVLQKGHDGIGLLLVQSIEQDNHFVTAAKQQDEGQDRQRFRKKFHDRRLAGRLLVFEQCLDGLAAAVDDFGDQFLLYGQVGDLVL